MMTKQNICTTYTLTKILTILGRSRYPLNRSEICKDCNRSTGDNPIKIGLLWLENHNLITHINGKSSIKKCESRATKYYLLKK
jgi:hypothetical protein